MKRIRILTFLFFSFLLLHTVVAFSYNVSDPALPSTKPYQGDTIILEATVTAASDNRCTITCQWQTNNQGPESIGNPEPLGAGQSKSFGPKVSVSGSNGQVSDKLIVTCQRYSNCLWGSSDNIPQKIISFSFNYPGDGTCTTTKEKCQAFSSFLGTQDCSCSATTECRPDSSRGVDDRGCATFCGNNIAEKQFETCSSCPKDIGKCDGLSCNLGSECEGKYCIHEICWNKPYKEGDGFCDLDKGENCKNSIADCACGSNERCSERAICETYCGNSICEASEVGVCKADCKWCGDGQCLGNENCNTCQTDCGVCENTQSNKEVTQKTQEIVQQNLEDVTKKQKVLTISTISVVVLVIVAYIIFKFVKSRKSKVKKETEEKKEEKVKKVKKNAK